MAMQIGVRNETRCHSENLLPSRRRGPSRVGRALASAKGAGRHFAAHPPSPL